MGEFEAPEHAFGRRGTGHAPRAAHAPVPGRGSLAEREAAASIDPARLPAELERARRELERLIVANRGRDPHASCAAATALQRQLEIARAVDAASPMARELAERAAPALAAAFLPSPAAIERAVWDREVAAWLGAGVSPLPDEIRGDLEAATGRSLAHVRVHDDHRGHATAAAHGARAVAIGSDIYVDAGQLDPASPGGRELLAHEVAHALQAGAPAAEEASTEAAEHEADAFAAAFGARGAAARFAPRVAVTDGRPLRAPAHAAANKAEPASSYVERHVRKILEIVRAQITASGPPEPHPRLPWADHEEAQRLLANGIDDYVRAAPGFALERLCRLAYPTELRPIIESARDIDPSSPSIEWRSAVGTATALAMVEPIGASIARMGMRLRVQLDESTRLPLASDLIASCPLDGVVAAVITTRGLISPQARRRGAPDDTPGKPFASGTREVTYTWLPDPALWNWIHVTSPVDATVEDVAHTPLAGEVSDGSEQAYRIAARPPYFGIPYDLAMRVPEAFERAPAEIRAELARGAGTRVADATTFDRGSISDRAALAEAPAPTRTDLPAERLLERIGEQLAFFERRLTPWHATAALAGAIAFVARRRSELESDAKAGSRWQGALAAQERIARAAADEGLQILDEIEAHASPADAVATPVFAVIEAYARAAGSSHLSASAAAALEAARRQRMLLPLALADAKVRAAAVSLDECAQVTEQLDAPPGAAAGTSYELGLRAGELRGALAAGKPLDLDEVERVAVDADEASLRASMRAIELQVRAIAARCDAIGMSDARYKGGLPTPRLLVWVLCDEPHGPVAGKLGVWRARLDAAARPDPGLTSREHTRGLRRAVDDVASAVAGLRHDADLAAWTSWSRDYIEDEVLDNLLMRVLRDLGIAILTGGLANAAVAMLGEGLEQLELIEDAREAAVVLESLKLVMQAGMMAGAQRITGDAGDSLATSFAENLLGLWISEAALRPFAGLLGDSDVIEPRVASTMAGLARRGGKLAIALVAQTSAGIGGSIAAHALLHRDAAAMPGVDEWLVQGLSIAATGFVEKRMQHLHGEVEQVARHLGHDRFDKALARIDRLAARAGSIEKPTPRDAEEMLAERKAILVELRTILGQLGADPIATSAQRALDRELAASSLEAPLRLAGLSPVVDGHVYEGTPDQIQRALDVARAAGPDFTDHFEPASRVHVVTAGATTIEIHEIASSAARPSGRAGPDLHSHFMGVLEVGYFIDKVGHGSATAAFEAIYDAFAADPAAQKGAAHGWRIAKRARAALEASAEADAEAVARRALTEMLAAGETTMFDQTYPTRGVIAEKLIGYREYTCDTLRALHDEGIGYSEQSIGLGKLDDLNESMVRDVHGQLAKEGKDVDVRFLVMVNTSRSLSAKATAADSEATAKQLAAVLQRGDVIGIDIAGPERNEFTPEGMQSFRQLYEIVLAAAKQRGRALVLRPHVGEGYNDLRDGAHVATARQNLETLVRELEALGYSPARGEQDGVIIRFGHATHATPEQLQRIARLGVTVEANIGSNMITGSVARLDDHPLLMNLYYGVKTVLGTDGGGVMQTQREREYRLARALIQRFRNGQLSLELPDGTTIGFKDIPIAAQRRFTVDTLQRTEDDYHARIIDADRADRVRDKGGDRDAAR